MSENEKYNGWSNRETWALNLLLSNDEGLYNMTRERVEAERVGAAAEGGSLCKCRAGEAVQALWDELTDPDEGLLNVEAILSLRMEVGSVWRVDWDEIGAAWLDGS